MNNWTTYEDVRKNMNHNDIWLEKAKLDKARRQHREELMKDYDSNIYEPAKKNLIELCGENTGHKYSCGGYNYLKTAIMYSCEYCGHNKMEDV